MTPEEILLDFLHKLIGRPVHQLPPASHAETLDEGQALIDRSRLDLECSVQCCFDRATRNLLIAVGTDDDGPEQMHWADLCGHHLLGLRLWADSRQDVVDRSVQSLDAHDRAVLRFFGEFLSVPIEQLPAIGCEPDKARTAERAAQGHPCQVRSCSSTADVALVMAIRGQEYDAKWLDLCAACDHRLRARIAESDWSLDPMA